MVETAAGAPIDARWGAFPAAAQDDGRWQPSISLERGLADLL